MTRVGRMFVMISCNDFDVNEDVPMMGRRDTVPSLMVLELLSSNLRKGHCRSLT